MEPVASVSLASTGGSHPPGWQLQLRVDYVVNRVMRTHRGQPDEVVRGVIEQSLRSLGVVPNDRQVAQYAAVIADMPPWPKR
ncbi:hypothetical protein [Mangrovihabitans endophyticus]|uniref:Uncharacterized protein n=1 Tax=Mangrovihabitans endophyticus TaxID=1751298 RepID=A0A8J3BYJ1_9ACTN|nr:hypothetical protein [Mangrovihabitans endophyticus]GGK84717.1 hypothetical protein GCM10012284_18820 [Mangrovihabitans endophyticus]